ncbi:hypothetical protein [Streptomyces alanosinicus]|nr:hypothetical protein [Streptomyces alanosinicus]
MLRAEDPVSLVVAAGSALLPAVIDDDVPPVFALPARGAEIRSRPRSPSL